MNFIRKDIFRLTMPILAEQAFITAMGMVNTIMAGRIGKEVVSAVGMVDSLNMIFIAFFSALAVGGTVVVAQYVGQNSIRKANEAAKQALYSSVLLAVFVTVITWAFREPMLRILFGSAEQSVINSAYKYLGITLLTYPLMAVSLVANGVLRGAGDMKTPMQVTIAMNVVNIIFSYILIFGINIQAGTFNLVISGKGIVGAALGISIARAFGAAVIFVVLIRGSRMIKLRRVTRFKFNREILMPIFNVGVPSSIESLLFNGGKLITQIYIVSMGTISIASNAISGSVAGFINVVGVSFSVAATTVVGQCVGRGNYEEAEDSLRYMTFFSMAALLVIGVLSIPLAGTIASLYSEDREIIALTIKMIRLNGLFMVAWPFSFVLPAGLRGAGDARYAMFTAIIGMWIFRITLGYVLGIMLNLGLPGVWLGMYTDWVVRGSLYYMRLKKGKWKNKAIVKTA
jgi:putative MATE family efflux protein